MRFRLAAAADPAASIPVSTSRAPRWYKHAEPLFTSLATIDIRRPRIINCSGS
jgi:hypothetical protein